MPTEASEADAGRQRSLDGVLRLAGDDDLASMCRPADPSRGVYGQTDVPRVGQGGTAAVDPGSDPAFQIVQPGPSAHRALDASRRLDRRNDLLEDREELNRAGVDLAAAGSKHRLPDDAPDIVQQVRVAIAELPEKSGGTLDVGQQERDEAGGERRRIG